MAEQDYNTTGNNDDTENYENNIAADRQEEEYDNISFQSKPPEETYVKINNINTV